jgi:hypothetical protein
VVFAEVVVMYLDDIETFTAKVELSKHTFSHVVKWCNDNFGSGTHWYTGTENDGLVAVIEFDNKDNMLLFVLRWS